VCLDNYLCGSLLPWFILISAITCSIRNVHCDIRSLTFDDLMLIRPDLFIYLVRGGC